MCWTWTLQGRIRCVRARIVGKQKAKIVDCAVYFNPTEETKRVKTYGISYKSRILCRERGIINSKSELEHEKWT